jgi:type II secretory pathway component GspD/PulD (secretin)
VIPQIVSEDHINMVIHPSVSSIGATVTGSTGLTAPRITIREADTQVMIRNGETIVIGGMLQDRTRDRVVGIPFLMDVPYLGNLVKRTKTDVTKVELLMFITPNIVTGNQFTDREKVVYQKTAEIEEVKSDESWDVIRRKLKKQFME